MGQYIPHVVGIILFTYNDVDTAVGNIIPY